MTPDTIGLKRRRRFVPILIVSCAVHVALAGYITYVAIRAAYGNLHVVDKSYKKLDLTHLLEKIHYPPNMLRGPAGPPLSLDQIRERARKRQQEMARLEAERKRKEEEEKKAEEARKKAAEEAAAKEAAAKEAAGKTTFGEINVAPIKDVVGKLYDLYQAGQVDLELDKLSITVAFKIDPDGSIPKSSIKVLKSSGSKLVDQDAIEILWMLGESHALGPLSSLSSNTIRLEVTSDIAKLSITSFATTPEDAKGKAFFLGVALGLLKKSQRDKNPAVAELLDHLTLKTDNKRLEADMTVSRARAAEMMRAQFAKSSATPTP